MLRISLENVGKNDVERRSKMNVGKFKEPRSQNLNFSSSEIANYLFPPLKFCKGQVYLWQHVHFISFSSRLFSLQL